VQRFPFIDLLLAQKRTHYALLPGQLSGPGSPIHLAAGLLNINFSRCRAKKMPRMCHIKQSARQMRIKKPGCFSQPGFFLTVMFIPATNNCIVIYALLPVWPVYLSVY